MTIPRILGMCGSLRAGSYNRRLLEAATEALSPDADLRAELQAAMGRLPVPQPEAATRS